MKTLYISLFALASSVSACAYAAEVSCSDTSSEGYFVTIASGGFTGQTLFANVIESTMAGPKSLTPAPFAVSRSDKNDLRSYSAKQFALVISMESEVPTSEHSAALYLNNKKVANLICNVAN